jgi:hypothetical protein
MYKRIILVNKENVDKIKGYNMLAIDEHNFKQNFNSLTSEIVFKNIDFKFLLERKIYFLYIPSTIKDKKFITSDFPIYLHSEIFNPY